MVLAGGSGTRLAPVLGDRPKALAPIRGKPFLDLLLDFLIRQSVSRVVFCVGHLSAALIERYAQWPGLETAFSIETEPLGTGGALRHAMPQVRAEHFYVLNGDSFCNIDLAELENIHLLHTALVTIAVTSCVDRDDVGLVELDAEGRVTSFMEKTPRESHPHKPYVNSGIYVFERRIFTDIQPGRWSLEHDLIPRWIRGGRCWAYTTAAQVVDIGTPDRYARAQDLL